MSRQIINPAQLDIFAAPLPVTPIRHTWQTLEAGSGEAGENLDCTVKALAAAAGMTYADAHAELKTRGRKDGHRFKMRQVWNAFTAAGFDARPVRDFRARTVLTLGREIAKRDDRRTLIIQTRGHVLAAVDGQILDWTAGRRHLITDVYEITPKGE